MLESRARRGWAVVIDPRLEGGVERVARGGMGSVGDGGDGEKQRGGVAQDFVRSAVLVTGFGMESVFWESSESSERVWFKKQ